MNLWYGSIIRLWGVCVGHCMECAGVGIGLTWIQHIVCVGIGVWQDIESPATWAMWKGKTTMDCRAGVLL